MKKHTVPIFIWLGVVLLLINVGIYRKEHHLASGQTVCLRLAPVDPRSLMQGDYMALDFALARKIENALKRDDNRSAKPLPNRSGTVILRLEANCTTSFVSLDTGRPLRAGEIRMAYRVRNHRVSFSTDAFFFKEGTGNLYANARYGVFKLNDRHQPLLYALKNADLTTLGQPNDP
jgi:uncharacterized membrane-anchored protein